MSNIKELKAQGVSDNTLALLRRCLKVYKKDLRCTPIVDSLLKSFEDKEETQIIKAIEIYEEKALHEGKPIHPNYFFTVLKSQNTASSGKFEQFFNKIVNWGKSI